MTAHDEPLTAREIVLGAFAIAAPIVGMAAVAFALSVISGCVYKGAKVVEGTDLAIGLNVPMSEGALQLQVLNYLSGFRLGVDQDATMRVRYTTSETNDYLGVVHTRTHKTIDAEVVPAACVTNGVRMVGD